MVVRSFVRKSVVILGGFQTSKWREKVFQWVSHEAGIFFLSALRKLLFSSEKANKPFRELANYVS